VSRDELTTTSIEILKLAAVHLTAYRTGTDVTHHRVTGAITRRDMILECGDHCPQWRSRE